MANQRVLEAAGASDIETGDGAGGPAPAAPRQAAPTKSGVTRSRPKWLLPTAVIVVGGLAYLGWMYFQPEKLPDGIAGSNGRIEATEIDVAAKIAGRIESVLVHEGDFVTAGQTLARMDTAVLNAELR